MNVEAIVRALATATKNFTPPLTDLIIDEYGKDPFLILISCLLSLRAKDVMTIHVCRDLFSQACTPQQLLAIPVARLEKILYRTGFYKTKTRVVRHVSQVLLDRFGGRVPSTVDDLLSMKGIGSKTANLVVSMAFDQPAICVDTHVHRISNRLGLIKTKTVEQTEQALQKVLPKKYWSVWNRLVVIWGQSVCMPVSPKCRQCAIRTMCKRVGVIKHR